MNARAWIPLPALVFAAALVAMAPGGFAQTAAPSSAADENHSAHHPPASGEAPAVAPNQPGGMPNGMTGQDGAGGMMNDDLHQMMSMMRTMMNMMDASKIETRIASLKTELKITDVQAPAWTTFADALRAAAASMTGMHQQMMQSGTPTTLPARLDRQEAMLTSRLGSVKTLKQALEPLYASFSDEQKKIADGMMIGPMGKM